MTLYRNPGTEDIWTGDELTALLRSEIACLDDENSLKHEVELHGEAAIREYIIDVCLVGTYSRVDDGENVAYQRALRRTNLLGRRDRAGVHRRHARRN